jgi:hypothetical protein
MLIETALSAFAILFVAFAAYGHMLVLQAMLSPQSQTAMAPARAPMRLPRMDMRSA